MVETRRLNRLAGSAIQRLSLPDGPLVVALSGGADSAALAWLCTYLDRETRALHVNHRLAHARSLESAARSIAAALDMEISVVGVEVPSGASPEGQARRARYSAFAEECAAGEALLTAHTLDDDAETVLINLIRGSGSRGLAGIPPHRPPSIHRPMLDISRSETREIAALAGLGFVDDPMNDDMALTRNWVRRIIVPQLEEANPRVLEAIHRAARLLREQFGEQGEGAASVIAADGSAKYPRGALLAAAPSRAASTMMAMLEHVLGRPEVTADRLGRMWSVLRGDTPRQELGGGVVVEREGPMLVVSRGGVDEPDGEIALTPGLHRAGGLEFEVRLATGPCRVLPLSNWAAVFPATTSPVARPDGVVTVGDEEAWIPGSSRLPVAWYEPGAVGYLSVVAREGTGWTSSR